jgi:bifunctional non-homologous end joining protein LigD
LREELTRRFRPPETSECPFANLPKKKPGPGGVGLYHSEDERLPVAETLLVGTFEFVEWTADNHLRHSKFIALRQKFDGCG